MFPDSGTVAASGYHDARRRQRGSPRNTRNNTEGMDLRPQAVPINLPCLSVYSVCLAAGGESGFRSQDAGARFRAPASLAHKVTWPSRTSDRRQPKVAFRRRRSRPGIWIVRLGRGVTISGPNSTSVREILRSSLLGLILRSNIPCLSSVATSTARAKEEEMQPSFKTQQPEPISPASCILTHPSDGVIVTFSGSAHCLCSSV